MPRRAAARRHRGLCRRAGWSRRGCRAGTARTRRRSCCAPRAGRRGAPAAGRRAAPPPGRPRPGRPRRGRGAARRRGGRGSPPCRPGVRAEEAVEAGDRHPSATRASLRVEPMKPAAPVTRTRRSGAGTGRPPDGRRTGPAALAPHGERGGRDQEGGPGPVQRPGGGVLDQVVRQDRGPGAVERVGGARRLTTQATRPSAPSVATQACRRPDRPSARVAARRAPPPRADEAIASTAAGSTTTTWRPGNHQPCMARATKVAPASPPPGASASDCQPRGRRARRTSIAGTMSTTPLRRQAEVAVHEQPTRRRERLK